MGLSLPQPSVHGIGVRGSERPAQLADRNTETQWAQFMGAMVGGRLHTGNYQWTPHCLASPRSNYPYSGKKRDFCVSGENLPAEVAARVGAMPAPGPGVRNQKPASVRLHSASPEDGGRGPGQDEDAQLLAQTWSFPPLLCCQC